MGVCDAHVHIGYYNKIGSCEPYYYSPRRVNSILNHAGVDEFIVSSTNAQIQEISLRNILMEAMEMRRIAGGRAHQLLWISGRVFDEDPDLTALDSGLYAGAKIHGAETPWLESRKDDLLRILDAVASREMIVQLHTADSKSCHPHELGVLAERYASTRMDFAHANPCKETIEVMRKCKNVFADTSFMPMDTMSLLLDSDVSDRVMFGSDFPAYHAYVDQPMRSCYYSRMLSSPSAGRSTCNEAFRHYIGIST